MSLQPTLLAPFHEMWYNKPTGVGCMAKFRDLIGEVFGVWRVVRRAENSKSGSAQWDCVCECGTPKTMRSNHLTSGNSKSCGCRNSPSLVGKKYGKLTVIDQDKDVLPGKGRWWICRCECGNLISTSSGILGSGGATTCGCWKIKDNKETAIRSLFTGYKSNSKRRKKVFDLTEEQFSKLIMSACHYCGIPPSQTFNVKPLTSKKGKRPVKYNGLDRMDNTKGYILGNCVPCCKICNNGKGELSFKDWFEHIKKVVCYVAKP